MDRKAWQATVHTVKESDMIWRLSMPLYVRKGNQGALFENEVVSES